jgi:hypothetical protein
MPLTHGPEQHVQGERRGMGVGSLPSDLISTPIYVASSQLFLLFLEFSSVLFHFVLLR